MSPPGERGVRSNLEERAGVCGARYGRVAQITIESRYDGWLDLPSHPGQPGDRRLMCRQIGFS